MKCGWKNWRLVTCPIMRPSIALQWQSGKETTYRTQFVNITFQRRSHSTLMILCQEWFWSSQIAPSFLFFPVFCFLFISRHISLDSLRKYLWWRTPNIADAALLLKDIVYGIIKILILILISVQKRRDEYRRFGIFCWRQFRNETSKMFFSCTF